MKANELKDFLKYDFRKYYDSVLINGPWGIGKTYYVKEFLREESPICVYISLFGKKSIDDINNDIIYQLSKKNIFKSFSFKAKKKINQSDIKLQLGSLISMPFKFVEDNIIEYISNQNGIENKLIFIFDDLERKSPLMEMHEILGLVENMKNINNVKTLMIVNEEELIDQDIQIFKSFKEKLIEKECLIKAFSIDAPYIVLDYEKLFNKGFKDKISEAEFELLVKNLIIDHKLDNLRTFNKIQLFINKMMDCIEFSKLNSNQSLELIRIIFSVVIEIVENKYSADPDQEEVVKELQKYFPGEEIRKSVGLIVLEKYLNLMNGHQITDIISNVINIYLDCDILFNIQCINGYYESINSKSNDRESIDMYFLSEEELVLKIKTFNEIKDEKIILSEWLKNFNRLLEYIDVLELDHKLDLVKINTTIDTHIENISITNKSLVDLLVDDFIFYGVDKHKFLIPIIIKINNKISERYYLYKFIELESTINDNLFDTEVLESLFHDLSFNRSMYFSNKIMDIIKCRKFFIQPMEGEIDEKIWTWNHRIWKSTKIHFCDNKMFLKEFIDFNNEKAQFSNRIGRYRYAHLNNYYGVNDMLEMANNNS